MLVRPLAALAAFIFTLPLHAQSLPAEADLRAHIEILASDEFQGRAPGTEGEALATNYIAERMAEAGLRPGYDGNYFQPVALIERHEGEQQLRWNPPPALPETHIGDILLLGNDDAVSVSGRPVVFAGYGFGEGVARFSGFDGAIVLFLAGWPEGEDSGPSYRGRIADFRDRGAAAVLAIVDRDLPWDAARNGMLFRQTYLASQRLATVEGIVSADTADIVLAAIGRDYDSLRRTAGTEGFVPQPLDLDLSMSVRTPIRRYDGINVVGLLPGSGHTGEAVLFSAHHDHFGICRDENHSDRICNGAVDNASGTAAVLETARALAAGPPPVRDILFLTTTAEELGLLGAHEFADRPPRPLANIVAVFNLDTIAVAPAGAPVGIIGRGMTPLDPLIDQVARESGRRVHDGLEVNAFVNRHDGWVFYERGVPAVMVGGSFTDPERLSIFFAGPYHAPDDEAEGLELGGAIEDVRLHVALGRAFADPARYPTPRR